MDTETRRKTVLEFVRKHQGCTKEDIVEGIKAQISRVPVFDTLQQLLEDKTIRDDSKNRRDHRLYVNTDNPLVLVPEELDEFEKAYLNLLENSLKRINEKDFSGVSKLLNIQETDPIKWNESDMMKYSKFEFEKWKDSIEISKEYTMALKKTPNPLQQLVNRINKLKSESASINDRISRNRFSDISRMQIEKRNTIIEQVFSLLDAYSSKYSYNIREFEISLLIHGAVAIFYLLRDTLFYRSILIWSNTVFDKETLKKLYTLVYIRIANLQLHLVKFLGSPRVRLIANPIEHKDPIGFLIWYTGTIGDHTISALLTWYHEMGMLELIEPIAASISRINKEIQDRGYSNPMFHQLEEGFEIIDIRTEADSKLQESRIEFQKIVGNVRKRDKIPRSSEV